MGIPQHMRSFASAIIDNASDVNIIQAVPTNMDDLYGMTPKLLSKFKDPDPSFDSLVFWYPDSYNDILNRANVSSKRYGYYIFEYTKIPQPYIAPLNSMDAIFTASQWGLDVLKNNGVNVPIHIVPGGVDSSIFNSNNKSLDTKRMKFLHIGKAEKRKGTSLVIQAFNEAFKGDRKIRLSLFIDNPHLRDFDADMFLNEMKDSLKLQYPIDNIDVRHFEQDIVSVYNSHHAAVFASKAEGIGLPIVEAMACGLPTIVPFNSGITAYANDSNAILLKDLAVEDIDDPIFFHGPAGYYGEWNSPKISELVSSMRWVRDNYDKAALIGNKAELDMRYTYSWDMAAKKFLTTINP